MGKALTLKSETLSLCSVTTVKTSVFFEPVSTSEKWLEKNIFGILRNWEQCVQKTLSCAWHVIGTCTMDIALPPPFTII